MQTRITDTLGITMSAGATSCTLGAGNFGSPTGKQIITLDYNVAAKSADFLCTIAGTAVTSMTRLNGPDVEHGSGCAVAMCMVDEHINLVFNALATGWVDINETITCSTNNIITASAAQISELEIGDKIAIKDDGTQIYGYVVDKPSGTTATLVCGDATSAAVTLASGSTITVPQFSKASSPVGFPANSKTFSPIGINYAEITSNFTTATSGSDVDVTNLAVTVTAPTGGALFKITVFTMGVNSSNNSSGGSINLKIKESTTDLSYTGYDYSADDGTSTRKIPMTAIAVVSATAGAHTYKASLVQNTAGTITLTAGATYPAFMLVEKI